MFTFRKVFNPLCLGFLRFRAFSGIFPSHFQQIAKIKHYKGSKQQFARGKRDGLKIDHCTSSACWILELKVSDPFPCKTLHLFTFLFSFLIPYTYALEMLSFEMNSEYEFFQIELPNFILEKNMNSDIFRTHELILNLRDTGF